MTYFACYSDAYQPDQTRTYSLDRLVNNKSTKRSISADNSYSESEMEPIIDMSPADDGKENEVKVLVQDSNVCTV